MTFNYLIVLYCILSDIVKGNHFLGGTITWRPLNTSATGTPIAIIITQTYSWSYSFIKCTQAMIASNSYVPSYGGLAAEELECIYNCGSGSIGYPNISVIPRCTDFSIFAETTVGQRSDTVYLEVGDNFSAAFRDSSWRPLATDPNAGWSISVHFIIKARSDTGLYNNAPVATVMSPINIPFNKTISIVVPVADVDGDTIRCRWSTKSNGINECRDVCPPNSLPPNTIIYPNCTIIITGQNISDWFAVAIMVEDFINSSSIIPLSSIPVQFLIQVINASSCPSLPEIIGIPIEQSCTPISVGQTFTSQLIARNNCGSNVTIIDISTLSFAGMITSNITKLNSTIYYKTLTWIPTISQLGYQIMCAMAFDSQNSQSAQYCFKFYVSQNNICSCSDEICSTTSTISITESYSDRFSWPLFGSIIGLVVFAVLTWCYCLCRYYLCPCGTRTYVYKKKNTLEFYHIEQCTDLKCQWWNTLNLSDDFSLSYTNHFNYNLLKKNINNNTQWMPKISNLCKPINGMPTLNINVNDRQYRSGNSTIKIPEKQNICFFHYLNTPLHSTVHLNTNKASPWATCMESTRIENNILKIMSNTPRTFISEDIQNKNNDRFKGTYIEFVPRNNTDKMITHF